jgi:hypothetical protein
MKARAQLFLASFRKAFPTAQVLKRQRGGPIKPVCFPISLASYCLIKLPHLFLGLFKYTFVTALMMQRQNQRIMQNCKGCADTSPYMQLASQMG